MRLQSTLLFAAMPLFAAPADWDRAKAFDYLETRQHEWNERQTCISCHTGLPYLFAGRAAGLDQVRPEREKLAHSARTRLAAPREGEEQGLSGGDIVDLLALSLQRRGPTDPLDERERTAIRRLWGRQIGKGGEKGAWTWFENVLHPTGDEESYYAGAALAGMALAAYPKDLSRPGDLNALHAFLRRNAAKQPLHNKLAWIAHRGDKEPKAKESVLRELWSAQSADGGWTSAALGPWTPRPAAPPDSGSNAYATAWAAFAARESGVSCSDDRLKRALDWLTRKQDRESGAWSAPSMNKVYPAGSSQSKFMTDAATGFAVAALVACGR